MFKDFDPEEPMQRSRVPFHSLEDRQVKHFLTERSGGAPKGSRHLPDIGAEAARPTFRLMRRKPIMAGKAELAANPRARSARLRAAIRTDAPAWTPARSEEAAT